MTPIEFVEQRLQSMIHQGADLGKDLPALLKHIEYAKILERQNNLIIDDTVNSIRVATGRSKLDSFRFLYTLRNEIAELCKNYNITHGKKF
jgi:hypothetical protein